MRHAARLLALGLTLVPAGPAPGEERSIRLHAANYRQGDGACAGGTNAFDIRIAPNTTGSIQIGIFESSAGAIGEMWRSSGWMAALVATTLLDQDPGKYRIAFDLGGRVDGPSAGALTTSGLLALLGDTGALLPDATMTGTINPDGTVGPVGGIPLKVAGVADAGFTRFGIPLGQREDVNPCTGEVVDVVELGRGLGVEVREIGDVREAFAFLSGHELPAPPAANAAIALTADTEARLAELTAAWQRRYDAAAAAAAASPPDLGPELAAFLQQAQVLHAGAQQDLADGHVVSAFNRTWLAMVNAEFVARALRAAQALRTGGFPALHAVVDEEWDSQARYLDARIAEVADVQARTAVDASAVAWTGGHLSSALIYQNQAGAQLDWSVELAGTPRPENFETIVRLAFEALGWLSLAGPLADAAVYDTEWVRGAGPELGPDVWPIDDAIDLYYSAASSNLAYVDALHTANLAKERQASVEAVRADLRRSDPAYLAAAGGLEQAFETSRLFADDWTGRLAELGTLITVVSSSSLLVAQHYSLGAETDELGRVTGFYSEAALAHMERLAEAEAAGAVAVADAATDGAAGPMLLIGLEGARRSREAALLPSDHLMALGLYWSTTLHARLITRLAKAAGQGMHP